jgi:hypothetical protein
LLYGSTPDTLKMCPWTLVYLIRYSMIYAWYLSFPSCFILIYGDLSPLNWF